MTTRAAPRRIPLRVGLVAILGVAVSGCGDDTSRSRPATPVVRVAPAANPTVLEPEVRLEVAERPTGVGGEDEVVAAVLADESLRVSGPDGDIRWERDARDVDATADLQFWDTAPAVTAGRVVVGARRDPDPGVTPSTNGTAIVALDAASGDVAWRYRTTSSAATGRLAVSGELVVVPIDGSVVALDDESGDEVWRWDAPGVRRGFTFAYIAGDVALVQSSRSISDDEIVGLDIATGAELWTTEMFSAVPPASEGGQVTVQDGARVRGLDPRTGGEVWSMPATSGSNGRTFGAVQIDDRVVVASATGIRGGPGTGSITPTWEVGAQILSRPLAAGDAVAVATSLAPFVDGAAADAVGVVAVDPEDGQVRWIHELEPGSLAVDLTPAGSGRLAVVSAVAQNGPFLIELLAVGDEGESVLFGVPSPAEALTARNVALAASLTALLFVIVGFPTTLMNSALGGALDRLRNRIEPWTRRFRQEPPDATPSTATFWRRGRGVVAYVALAAMLQSGLQRSWGLNAATILTFGALFVALLITTTVGLAVHRGYLTAVGRHHNGGPRLALASLPLAAACVAASRMIGFVPGYVYGIVADYEPGTSDTIGEETQGAKANSRDAGRISALTAAAVLLTSVAAWMLMPVFDALGGHDTTAAGVPYAIAAAVFLAGVETLLLGLAPITFLPGASLRAYSRTAWIGLWGSGLFLFCLALLHPGLARASSRSIIGTIGLAFTVGGAGVAFWWIERRRVIHDPRAEVGTQADAASVSRRGDAVS